MNKRVRVYVWAGSVGHSCVRGLRSCFLVIYDQYTYYHTNAIMLEADVMDYYRLHN